MQLLPPSVHEMAHVFATTDKPDNSSEIDFLGFEVRLAASVGLYRKWSTGNYSYGLNGRDWNDATARHKSDVIKGCIFTGIKLGNINATTLAPQPLR